MDPLRTFSVNQATHTEPALKKSNHMSLMQQARFQVWRSLIPKPPCSLVSTHFSHATLAVLVLSISPFQRKTLQSEFILLMQAFGKMNAEHQNVIIPEMTILMRSKRPAKERDFSDQEESLFLIWCRRGLQLTRLSFLELRGTPRYRTSRTPQTIPVEAWIVSFSASDRPEALNLSFAY